MEVTSTVTEFSYANGVQSDTLVKSEVLLIMTSEFALKVSLAVVKLLVGALMHGFSKSCNSTCVIQFFLLFIKKYWQRDIQPYRNFVYWVSVLQEHINRKFSKWNIPRSLTVSTL